MEDIRRYQFDISDEIWNRLYSEDAIQKHIDARIMLYPPRHINSLSMCCHEKQWMAHWWNSDKRHDESGLARITICPKCLTVWIYTGAGNLIVLANDNTPAQALERYNSYNDAHTKCDALDELAEKSVALFKDVLEVTES